MFNKLKASSNITQLIAAEVSASLKGLRDILSKPESEGTKEKVPKPNKAFEQIPGFLPS